RCDSQARLLLPLKQKPFDPLPILGDNPSSQSCFIGDLMTHDVAVSKAREIAGGVLAPSAGQNDKAGRFSTEAVKSLGEAGLLGLMLPTDSGGSGFGPRPFAAVVCGFAEGDRSFALGYVIDGNGGA